MNTRRAAGLAVAAAGALQGAGQSDGAAGGEAEGEAQAPKKTSRGLLIGLGVVVVVVLLLLAFFAFWDFSGGEAEGSPDPEAVPAETVAEPGVSDPSSSGA